MFLKHMSNKMLFISIVFMKDTFEDVINEQKLYLYQQNQQQSSDFYKYSIKGIR